MFEGLLATKMCELWSPGTPEIPAELGMIVSWSLDIKSCAALQG